MTAGNEETMATLIITNGMKLLKQFGEDYYKGTVFAGPFLVESNRDTADDNLQENAWHIKYEDGDEEDLFFDEILQGRNDFLDREDRGYDEDGDDDDDDDQFGCVKETQEASITHIQ